MAEEKKRMSWEEYQACGTVPPLKVKGENKKSVIVEFTSQCGEEFDTEWRLDWNQIDNPTGLTKLKKYAHDMVKVLYETHYAPSRNPQADCYLSLYYSIPMLAELGRRHKAQAKGEATEALTMDTACWD